MRWLALLLSLIGLAACSSIPTAPLQSGNPWVQNLPIDSFTAWGKMSVKSAHQAGQLRFFWQEDKPQSTILLETPLGNALAKITREGSKETALPYRLTTAEHPQAVPYPSLEAIVADLFKSASAPLPQGFIKDMLLGQNQTHWQQWQQSEPAWQTLTWRIDADTPPTATQHQLPHRILIEQPPFSIRLAVESWRIPPPASP